MNFGNVSLVCEKKSTFIGFKVESCRNNAAERTCIPAFTVPILCVLHPLLVPGVRKIHQQNKLNQNEDEGPNHTKVVPHCNRQNLSFTSIPFNQMNWHDFTSGSRQLEVTYFIEQRTIYI